MLPVLLYGIDCRQPSFRDLQCKWAGFAPAAPFPLQVELWTISLRQPRVQLPNPSGEDATHVNAFFRRAGIATLTTRELFDFAVDPSIHAGNLAEALEQLQEVASRCAL